MGRKLTPTLRVVNFVQCLRVTCVWQEGHVIQNRLDCLVCIGYFAETEGEGGSTPLGPWFEKVMAREVALLRFVPLARPKCWRSGCERLCVRLHCPNRSTCTPSRAHPDPGCDWVGPYGDLELHRHEVRHFRPPVLAHPNHTHTITILWQTSANSSPWTVQTASGAA